MKKNKILINVLATLLVLSVVFLIVALVVSISAKKNPNIIKGEFVPPEHEATALVGEPTLSDGEKLILGWNVQVPNGATFRAGFPMVVSVTDGVARVLFSNPESNTIYLKLRLFGEAGNLVGETGYLKPGEYLNSVTLSASVGENECITIKGMAYTIPTEEDTGFRSAGAFTIESARDRGNEVAAVESGKLQNYITDQQLNALGKTSVSVGDVALVSLCTSVEAKGSQLNVWFNAPDNADKVFLVEVLNVGGNVLTQSGFIGGGNFVKALYMPKLPEDGTSVVIRVAAFDATTKELLGVTLTDATILNATSAE